MLEPDIPAPDPHPRPPAHRLPQGACDCHAHLFGPGKHYPYHPERNYTPPDASFESYRHLLSVLGFERAVLVQPSVYGTDNRCLANGLRQARDKGLDWRGIAVLDSTVSDTEIARLHDLGVRGIRINLLFKGGVDFDSILSLSERIKERGWHLQCLIDVSDLADLDSTLKRFDLPKVIDHMGHVPTHKGTATPGFQQLLSHLDRGDTWVKLSGPNRITSQPRAPYHDVDPFLAALVERNEDRCVFGTDWPHVQLPGPIPNDGDLVDELLRLVDGQETLEKILVRNPKQLYGFQVPDA